ncbi:hypothetical protein OJ253_2761 [Cryptosporidium canis]|uniref:Uncharacterized protein n=1 Tax=Cryptosporidium canis TaxID=195482 RepID=A0A9D5DEW6_9CRYT|nr:hypothetical protein OJ253_2761 [Cryptosporidium canis]
MFRVRWPACCSEVVVQVNVDELDGGSVERKVDGGMALNHAIAVEREGPTGVWEMLEGDKAVAYISVQAKGRAPHVVVLDIPVLADADHADPLDQRLNGMQDKTEDPRLDELLVLCLRGKVRQVGAFRVDCQYEDDLEQDVHGRLDVAAQ